MGLYVLDREVIQDMELLDKERGLASLDEAETTSNKHNGVCISAASSVNIDIWHQRLGQMSSNKMRIVPDLDVSQHDMPYFICEICLKAKQHRLPFPVSKSVSACAFELIHVDT